MVYLLDGIDFCVDISIFFKVYQEHSQLAQTKCLFLVLEKLGKMTFT